MARSQSTNSFILDASRRLLAVGFTVMTSCAIAQDASTRYAQILADADITARYNVVLEQQVQSQQGELASLEQQIAALDATAQDIQPMLQRMFDELEQFIAADVPFRAKERSDRIDRLRGVMSQIETTASEKFRRLMEAYQIEMEYGRTMDSYRDTIGDGREADMVRLGRISLMYRTVDGVESGYWDNQQKAWIADPSYARAVELALRIAKQEGAPDLITVPVPAPQGGQS
jgi:hypothetical protein